MLNIEELYGMLSNKKGNEFDTNEEQKLYKGFQDKYITPLIKGKGFEFTTICLCDFANVIDTERRIGFENGFKTAVSLLFGVAK